MSYITSSRQTVHDDRTHGSEQRPCDNHALVVACHEPEAYGESAERRRLAQHVDLESWKLRLEL